MSRPLGSSTLETGAVRTYHGRTVEDLIPKIQDDLGPDAIIVQRREGLTGGVAGFFQRPYVEIDAIPGGPRIDLYDEDPALPPAVASPPSRTPPPTRTPFYEREPPHASQAPRYVTGHLAALAHSSTTQVPVRESPKIPTPPSFEPADPFAKVLEQATSREETRQPTAPPRTRARGTVQSKMVSLGTSQSFAEETIDAALAHIMALAPRIPLGKAVGEALKRRIPVAPPLPARGAAIVLVGAGGAGKTSCCAALLAAYRANSSLRASCATLVRGHGKDEWQLLLSPQLRKPVPANSERAGKALRKAKAEGLLVIDTPSLSPGEGSAIRKLGALLGALEPERVTVALPTTLGAVAAAQLLEALRPLKTNALALTHADETDQIGVAVQAACEWGLAPEYTLDRARAGGWKLRAIDPTGLAATLLP